MKKLFTMMIAFSFLLAGCDKEMESLELGNTVLKSAGTGFINPNTFDADGAYCVLASQTPEDLAGKQMEIWMGVGNSKAGTLVGHVRFTSNSVIIDLTDVDGNGIPDMYPYVATVAHIHFAESLSGIPQTKKGNPIPGKFEYNIPLDPSKSLIEIPVTFNNVGAIHLSVVKYGGIGGFEFYLPKDPVKVAFTFPGPDSYMQMKITSPNAGALIGTYENWCVNTQRPMLIYDPLEYDALLYSSYDENLPANILDILDKPDNLDLINYLINNYYEGKEVELKNEDCTPFLVNGNTVTEKITLGDIQKAIWELIDDGTFGLPDGWESNPKRVNAIVCEVEKNGEDFEPKCDQKIVFLVVPLDPAGLPVDPELGIQLILGQPTISSVPVPCADEGGTAWGDGYYGATFGGAQWGTWFKYGTCEE